MQLITVKKKIKKARAKLTKNCLKFVWNLSNTSHTDDDSVVLPINVFYCHTPIKRDVQLQTKMKR